MKILFLAMSLGIGGAETHILELSRALVKRGHAVTVASRGGVYVPALTEAGAKHIEAPLSSKNPAALNRAYRILSDLLKKESFDLIHAHARIPGVVGEKLAKKFDLPFVTTFHGTFNPVWYWRLLTRTGERTLAVSEDIRAYLKQYYAVPDEKITVTVNGIDTVRFNRADAPKRSRNEILCVTRLDSAAAWHIFRMIESMPAVVAAYPDARLTVVGGGDVLDEVRVAAEKTDAALGGGKITVTGPRTDVDKLYQAADIFVGVSRSAMEAMACCLPVVLTGAQGHLGVFDRETEAEAISTNLCCRGREAGTTEQITACVLRLLAMKDAERRAMGDYNRAVIENNYSVSRMTDDAENFYRATLREHICHRSEAVISGYYGFGNAGDDALLQAIAEGLRERGVYRLAALSKTKEPPAAGVKGVPRFRFVQVVREIRRAKVFVSGGGSLLQDATSTKSLLYYTGVIRLAHHFHVPTVIFANGIGPLTREKNRERAARAVRLADYISVRDDASAQELTAMGIEKERIHVTADPVFGDSRPAAGNTSEVPDRPYIVLSLRETADGRSTETLEKAVADALGGTRDYKIVLLPMQARYDTAICARMAERLRASGADAQVLAHADADTVRAVIGNAAAVIAMRLHGLIFAAAAAVPILALSYDPKIDALMRYFRAEQYTLPAFETDAETLRTALEDLLAHRETLTAALAARRAELAPLCGKDLDETVKRIRNWELCSRNRADGLGR